VDSPSAESNDPSFWIVRRYTYGDPISRNHLNPKSTHAPAQLREYFMARITLNPIQPAAVNSDDSSLDVDEIFFTQ
jgi:hypothetical protein